LDANGSLNVSVLKQLLLSKAGGSISLFSPIPMVAVEVQVFLQNQDLVELQTLAQVF